MSGEAADHASTSRAPGPDIEAEADMGRTPDTLPIEDADSLFATNSKVESAMNHRRRRAVLRNGIFLKRHLMPSTQETHTSALPKLDSLERPTSMQRLYG